MPEIERAANLDIVAFPRDKTVLLAHTPTEFSIGLVHFGRNSAVVLWLPDETDCTTIPLTNNLVSAAIRIAAVPATSTEEAAEIAMGILQGWLMENMDIGPDGYPTEPPPVLTPGDITEFVEDSPIGTPQLTQGGARLPLGEELNQQEALARIRDNGHQIIIRPILQSLID